MARVPAGYDKLSALGNLGADTVITAGLMNCIGIACINATRNQVAIAHFNTALVDGLLAKDIQKATNYFSGLRNWLVAKTAAERFEIGVGCVWYDAAGKFHDAMRHVLLVALTNVFKREPVVWGKCVRYAAGTLEGSPDESWVDGLDWAHVGTDIPYDDLRPALK